jgi:hypothetical protein
MKPLFFSAALKPKTGLGRLVVEVSISNTHRVGS